MSEPLDLVLYGASGFTGRLTAAYLARHAPAGLRWGIAGRSRDRLTRLRAALDADVPIVLADAGDPRSLAALADGTRVVASTVGPYLRYGEPLVAACAAAGTDYADLTGEGEFVDLMYLRYHATAVERGARLVHCCGFDSIPADLGAQFTVEQLPADVPIRLRGYVSAGGRPSGGTVASALDILGRARQAAALHAQRRQAEPAPVGRTVRAVAGRPGYDADVAAWVVPLPVIDPQVVVSSARQLPRYGPSFTYTHYAALSNPLAAAGLLGGAAGLLAAAQLPPARALIRRLVPAGEGPSAEQRASGWFRLRFVGEADGVRAVTEVTGGDPGYGETAKMLACAAMCLAQDDLAPVAGQLTPAAAMGATLRARLQRAGIAFTVLERSAG